jgi:hypothetical protein
VDNFTFYRPNNLACTTAVINQLQLTEALGNVNSPQFSSFYPHLLNNYYCCQSDLSGFTDFRHPLFLELCFTPGETPLIVGRCGVYSNP